MSINYVDKDNIDHQQWDKCIENSINGSLYAYTWYLDTLFGCWGGLIEDNYHAVMPLTIKNGFLYAGITDHPLLKHTGIFSRTPVTHDKLKDFLNSIPKKFRKLNICLNRQNTQVVTGYTRYKKEVSYGVDLISSYDKQKQSFSGNYIKLLTDARIRNYRVMNQPSLKEIIGFLENSDARLNRKQIIEPLHRIISRLIAKNRAEVLGVYSPENNLFSVACFVRSNVNVSLLFAHTLASSDSELANILILDYFISKYAGRNVTLSLEHIDNSWNDFFYKSIGAHASFNYRIIENRLPPTLKWL